MLFFIFKSLHILQVYLIRYPLDKINSTKNPLFFLSQAPIHHSFTFNLQFFYELNVKVWLSKTVWDFSFPILFHFY